MSAPNTFQCRHDTCTYRKRVWKDRRSRNVHEASMRFHKCPPGCFRCESKDSASPKELGQALCPHDGCNRLYNRRHMRAHMANEKLHRLQCTPNCEECAKMGWESVQTGQAAYHVPLPAATSAVDHRRQQMEREELKMAAARQPGPAVHPPQAQIQQEAMYMHQPAGMSSFDRAAVDRFALEAAGAGRVPPPAPPPVDSFIPNGTGLEHVRFDSIFSGNRENLFDKELTPSERMELGRRREEALLLLSRITGCDDPTTNLSFLMTPTNETYKPAPNGRDQQQLMPSLDSMHLPMPPADPQPQAARQPTAPPPDGQ